MSYFRQSQKVAYFHPALHGAPLWQGASCKPTILASLPSLKGVPFLSWSMWGLPFHMAWKPSRATGEILGGQPGANRNWRGEPRAVSGQERGSRKVSFQIVLRVSRLLSDCAFPLLSFSSVHETVPVRVRRVGMMMSHDTVRESFPLESTWQFHS